MPEQDAEFDLREDCAKNAARIDKQVNAIASVLAKAVGDDTPADENDDEACRRTTVRLGLPAGTQTPRQSVSGGNTAIPQPS